MKHRIDIDISFDQEEDAVAFLNLIQGLKHKFYNGDTDPIKGVARARYYECRHDEVPPLPCGQVTPYKIYDLKDKKIEKIKTKAGKSVSADAIVAMVKKEGKDV